MSSNAALEFQGFRAACFVSYLDTTYVKSRPSSIGAQGRIRWKVWLGVIGIGASLAVSCLMSNLLSGPQARRGFVLLPRRWVVERSLAWVARFRRLARDYERLPQTLAGLHYLAFAILLIRRFVDWMAQS